jgi:hypothetical protein
LALSSVAFPFWWWWTRSVWCMLLLFLSAEIEMGAGGGQENCCVCFCMVWFPPIVYSCDSIYMNTIPVPVNLEPCFTSTPPTGANVIVQNKRA